jgi:endonuclease/exonuclease/phosphatase family metal-dependent hydrolase
MAHLELRIVQLNIGSLFEPEWERRRVEIVSWLEYLQPDVVCLEEAWESAVSPNTVHWIVDAMPAAGWHWQFGGGLVGRVGTERGQLFGSAVLSRWPIESFSHELLGMLDDPDLDARMAGFPFELVHARTAGLDIFATHLAAAPIHGLHRCAQVAQIDRRVRAVRGGVDVMGKGRASMPPILCGDFNAEPDSDEIRFLCGFTPLGGVTTFWQDAWRVAGDGTPGLTQDWRDNPIGASLNIHRKRIDYVFVGDPFLRRGSGGRVLNAEIAFHEPRTGILASDHRGLVVDIVWPDRPTAC